MEFFWLAVGRLLAVVVSCGWYWVVLDSLLVVVGGRIPFLQNFLAKMLLVRAL